MSETATPTLLEDLRDKRSTLAGELDTLIDERESAIAEIEARTADADEEQRTADQQAADDFNSAVKALEADIAPLDQRIEHQEDKEKRRTNANRSPVVEITHEPSVYRKDNASQLSYYKDLLCTHSELRHLAPRGAADRIESHRKESELRGEKREAENQHKAEGKIEQAEKEFRASFTGLSGSLNENPFERRANPSRETGHGGEFVPPLWLVEDDFIPALRAARVIAPLCRNLPVPPGTDTIKLPKIKLGTEVAPQLADNAGVASRDVETEYVEAAVKTLAGQEDVAIQLIEQSPGQVFDRVVQEDLLMDYHLKLDREVSFGQGTNYTTLNAGTIRGLFPGTEWGAGFRTSAKTLEEFPSIWLMGLNANWSHIAKERFDVQNVHHVINPAFSSCLASLTDGAKSEAGRLFINASDFPNYNISGEMAANTVAEGHFLQTPLGPNIYHSANIPPILPQAKTEKGEQKSILFAANKEPNKLTTSGTEAYSYGLTAKFDDIWFFESDLRTRVLPEVLSGTLQIRFQVYAYISLLVRYGPSLQFCGGKSWKVAGGFAEAPVEPALAEYKF
jgi:hypothetical protein